MRWKSVFPLCAMMGFKANSVSNRYKSVCDRTGPSVCHVDQLALSCLSSCKEEYLHDIPDAHLPTES